MPKHSNNLTKQNVEKDDYQVISQKNLGNLANQGNDAKEYRKSLIDSKLKQQKNGATTEKKPTTESGQASARQQSTREKDLETKIQKLEKERKELKFELQKQKDDIDHKNKKIKELEQHI